MITEQRLRNLRVSSAARGGPARLVAWLGAVQAQEYGPAKWALGLRLSPGATDAAIERAIAQGRILRTHVLRPTWHFVTPADIRWMLELTAPHVHRAMSYYRRGLGLDTDMLNRGAALIERALGDGDFLTRAELGAHLERAGLPAASAALSHHAMYAELEGLICSGPRRGKQSTYALLATRVPPARRLEGGRDEALAELTRRYFRSHGPATIRDFVWWSGLRTPDAKRGLEMNRAKAVDVGGLKYWTIDGVQRRSGRKDVHLLPIYDEYLVAYRDRVAVPHMYSLGNFWHALVIGGQVAGTWRTARDDARLVVQVTAGRRLTAPERLGVKQGVARYARFLRAPEVSVLFA